MVANIQSQLISHSTIIQKWLDEIHDKLEIAIEENELCQSHILRILSIKDAIENASDVMLVSPLSLRKFSLEVISTHLMNVSREICNSEGFVADFDRVGSSIGEFSLSLEKMSQVFSSLNGQINQNHESFFESDLKTIVLKRGIATSLVADFVLYSDQMKNSIYHHSMSGKDSLLLRRKIFSLYMSISSLCVILSDFDKISLSEISTLSSEVMNGLENLLKHVESHEVLYDVDMFDLKDSTSCLITSCTSLFGLLLSPQSEEDVYRKTWRVLSNGNPELVSHEIDDILNSCDLGCLDRDILYSVALEMADEW